MELWQVIGLNAIVLCIAAALAYQFWVSPLKRKAAHLLEQTQREAQLAAREESLKARSELEDEIRERQRALSRQEEKLLAKDEALEERKSRLKAREDELDAMRGRIAEQEGLNAAKQEQLDREFERIARMTREEARAVVIQQAEADTREIVARRAKIIETETLAKLDHKVREILMDAMQRGAVETVSEATISVIQLPGDDMKGRIIGREGRNIRAFEQLTGVDLIIDDTPETVVVSCFDPVRREIATETLRLLVEDGRIHPTHIEELFQKATEEIHRQMAESAQRAVEDAGVGPLPPELFDLLGRLKYRTSYGQNVLTHSVEVARFAGIVAAELGLKTDVARRAGLLHDIGKGLGPDSEGPHALAGMEVLRKAGEKEEVVQAVGAHHSEIESPSEEAAAICLADSLSASRPGARREGLEHYIRRLSALESLAAAFPGVERAYAIQAGREIRLIVRPNEVTDAGAARLAEEVVKRIEREAEYPGTIRVTVIRESRFTQTAK